jgi:microcystin-dependent protein
MAIWQWSTTAANNSTADPSISWPEGMPPSAVNDSARGMMSVIAAWRNDISGQLLDTGTASAYVVTTSEGVQTPTPVNGTRISFVPANTNNSGVTLAVDGGTAFQINSPGGTNIPAGTMIVSTPYDLVFFSASNQWLLKGVFGAGASPNLIPLGGIIDYTGSTAPNANFVLPFGQAISRATYAPLFTIYNALSLPYGSGDGSTTFNVPDCRGSVIAGLDNMGGSARGVLSAGTSLGIFGGEQAHLLVTGEMPSHNHGITDPGHIHAQNSNTLYADANPSVQNAAGSNSTTTVHNTASATTGITINNTGGGAVHNNVQPTIVLNKILRIL